MEETMAVAMEETMAVAIAVTVAVAMAVAMEEVMVAIPNLKLLTPLNLQVQKAGKIEVMVIHLKILIMKVVEAGEKGEFLIRVIHQMRKINNLFLQVWKLI
jgi:hypothetical protein